MDDDIDAPESRIAGAWHRWTRTQEQAEADELRRRVQEMPDTQVATISRCMPGNTVTVTGVVRSVTLRPRNNTPALEIELYDGSGTISVIWLGRRRIPGIDAGRSMVVRGRLTCNTDKPTIYNPFYKLKPTASA